MQSRITGTTMPVLEFLLEPNDAIISEAGELSWMGRHRTPSPAEFRAHMVALVKAGRTPEE